MQARKRGAEKCGAAAAATALEPQGKAQISQESGDTKHSKKFEKGVDKRAMNVVI